MQQGEEGDSPGAAGRQVLWTVGHSNHPIERFLELLNAHQIAVLADVRSQPYSKFSPQFNAAPLKETMTAQGLHYAFFGDTLGGRPNGDAFYDEEGHVRYDRLAESDLFREGIRRLKRGIARGTRVAMMCSEEDPAVCHRHLLVGRVLASEGITLCHIRGDGRMQTDADLLAKKKDDGQGSLFDADTLGEMQKEGPWRSLLSVSPRQPPSDSSGG
jgi:uncharacterized protein (DUF488 family)